MDRSHLGFEAHIQQTICLVQDQTFDVSHLRRRGSTGCFLGHFLKTEQTKHLGKNHGKCTKKHMDKTSKFISTHPPVGFSYARSSSLLPQASQAIQVRAQGGQATMNVAVCSRWYDKRPGVAQRRTKPFRKRAFSLLGFSPPGFRVEPMRGHPIFFQLENRMTSEVSPHNACLIMFFHIFSSHSTSPLPKSKAICGGFLK